MPAANAWRRRFSVIGLGSTIFPGFIRPSGSQIRLNSPEGFDELRAEHLRKKLRARLPVAVLARERSAVGHDEVRGFVEERPDAGDPLLRLEVEVDARVDASLSEVPVEVPFVAMLLVEPRAGPAGRRRASPAGRPSPPTPPRSAACPERARSRRAPPPARARPAGPPPRRRASCPRRFPGVPGPGAAPSRPTRPANRRRTRSRASRVRAAADPSPPAGGRSPSRPRPAGRRMPSRPIGRWASAAITRSAAAATSGNPSDEERAGLRVRDQEDRRLEDRDAGAFRADERPRDVKAVFGEEAREVVAGDPPRNVRKTFPDEARVLVAELRNAA